MSSKNLQKNVVYVGLVIFVLAISYQYFYTTQVRYLALTTFKECVEAGYRVQGTYPETCIAYGKNFMNPLQKKMEVKDTIPDEKLTNDYKSMTYIIDGEQIRFHDGKGVLPPNFVLKQASTTVVIDDHPFFSDINGDSVQDIVFLAYTLPVPGRRSAYYISASVSLHEGFYGSNAVFLDYSLYGAAFVYKNGEVTIGYTTLEATTTLQQKYFVVENDILKQLSHK